MLFQAQSSKLERLFCQVSVKTELSALSFELPKMISKMLLQLGWAMLAL